MKRSTRLRAQQHGPLTLAAPGDVADPHTGIYRACGLLVVIIAGDRITAVTGFNASVMPRSGLPRTLP